VVTSTCINSFQRGRSIGCSCHNKTDGKLRAWLEQKFSEATVNTQFRGPKTDCGGQTHFDFHLTFSDGFEVILELDGAQHFWSHLKYYTNEGCERDLAKEKWAIAKGLSVVRVLQQDVWKDKLGWQKWLTKSIENARMGEARPITPDAPEYRSSNSAYVQLRSRSCADMKVGP
jgi:very-short-patch-repair endonuclease